MNIIALVIYFGVASIVISTCALALLRINSTFVEIFKRYATSVAVLLAVISIFAFLINDIVPTVSLGTLCIISAVMVFSFAFINHMLSLLRRSLLEKYKADNKSNRKNSQPSRLPLVGIVGIDVLGGLMAGFVLGCGFLASVGSGIMTALALSLFLLTRSLAFVERYRVLLKLSGKRLRLVLLIPLYLVPVVALAVYLIFSQQHDISVPLLSVVFSYLLYLAIWQFIFIVKAHKK